MHLSSVNTCTVNKFPNYVLDFAFDSCFNFVELLSQMLAALHLDAYKCLQLRSFKGRKVVFKLSLRYF